ncbi:olfactory receptor 14I1-like isoform X3 [Rhineura floridana]|uniref:olfactory receptor 14I1-like isoform X3 n=1 Tax=Rhineura floridana TaxID=261503 RepID=UPI002AC81703|nr:olfactory receptor 14I1-like isoform X3 [Rhineura floridana]
MAESISVMNEHLDNKSYVSVFLLLELSAIRELQILHFFLFLGLYLIIVSGNLLIIAAVAFDRRLHTPMYFFLINLAIQDIGAVSVTLPKSMVNSVMNTRQISYAGCVVQVFGYLFFAVSDIFLLTVMGYDRLYTTVQLSDSQNRLQQAEYPHNTATMNPLVDG